MLPSSLLKEARQRAGLSQVELGARTDSSGAAISRWERGAVALTFERLETLVQGCGLELDVALRPADRSQHPLMRGNVARSPRQRLRGLKRHLQQTAEIQGREDPFDPEQLLLALAKGGIDFIVIGAVAATLWGSPFPTHDLDIVVRAGVRNRRRFERALGEMSPSHRKRSDDVEEYSTSAGVLCLVAEPPSMPSYQTLRRRAELMRLGDVEVRVAPLPDVIRSAESRPQPNRRAEILTLRKLATEIGP